VLQSLAQEGKGINTTVDAVQKTVDQTQRDVQGIKDMLESCKYKTHTLFMYKYQFIN